MEKEQAYAGRDGRTRLAIPNSQARTRTGNYPFFEQDWHETLTQLIHYKNMYSATVVVCVMTTHTCNIRCVLCRPAPPSFFLWSSHIIFFQVNNGVLWYFLDYTILRTILCYTILFLCDGPLYPSYSTFLQELVLYLCKYREKYILRTYL